MNAQEAKKLTKTNYFKLADEMYKQIVFKLNEEIRTNASKGLDQAKVTILQSNVSIKHEIGKRVKEYFESLGFDVVLTNGAAGTSQYINCYWKEEK